MSKRTIAISAVGLVIGLVIVGLVLALSSSHHATSLARNQASAANARDDYSSEQWRKTSGEVAVLTAEVKDLQSAAAQAYNCLVADQAIQAALVNRLPTNDAYAKADVACQGILPRLAKIMS